VNYEAYYTSSYIGIERKFGERLNLKAIAEDVRAWRIVGANWGNAQNLRPQQPWTSLQTINGCAGFNRLFRHQEFSRLRHDPKWFSISYARPFRANSMTIPNGRLEYPIRFSAGIQQESFFNFTGDQNQQFRPYVRISLF